MLKHAYHSIKCPLANNLRGAEMQDQKMQERELTDAGLYCRIKIWRTVNAVRVWKTKIKKDNCVFRRPPIYQWMHRQKGWKCICYVWQPRKTETITHADNLYFTLCLYASCCLCANALLISGLELYAFSWFMAQLRTIFCCDLYRFIAPKKATATIISHNYHN